MRFLNEKSEVIVQRAFTPKLKKSCSQTKLFLNAAITFYKVNEIIYLQAHLKNEIDDLKKFVNL